jgi:hypothetical protein
MKMLLCRSIPRISRSHIYSSRQVSIPYAYASNSKSFSSVEGEIQEANIRYAGKIDIRETGQYGWGLFALCDFKAGVLVMRGRAVESGPARNAHSVQTDWNTHATMDLPARFVNHVCNEANVGIQKNDVGAYDFHALRRIHMNEEFLWDYETSEYEIKGFVCSCGRPNCRGELRGFRQHADEIIASYGEEYVAPFLLERRHQLREDEST